MRLEGIVFIHPKDFGRVLKNDGNALDMVIEEWWDGIQINTINGIHYRQTLKVPQELYDFDAEDNITNTDADGNVIQD